MSASQRAAVQLPSYLSASSPFGSSLAASKLSEQTGIRVRRQAGKRLIEETIKEHVQRVNSNDCSPVEEESIFVADIGEVYRQCRRWASCLPNVAPFYAVKCNDDPVLLRVLAFLNVGFDCASINEMKTILGLGVDPSRIIYAAPCKAGSHLRYAAQRGVRKTVFDNETELYKIEKLHPEAELYLRIRADEPSNGTRLADKFGASVDETHSLLALTKRLGLRLVGISFHVGSPSLEPQAFLRAVQDARSVYDEAVREGFTPQSIDVGGGFTNDNFESSAVTLSMALAREFGGLLPTVRFMGEPGRFIASEVFSLACKVIGVRSKPKDMIYINDGIYGNFLNALIEPPIPAPILLDLTASTGTPLQPQTDPKAVPDYIIWGRTCDGADRVI